MENSLVIFNKGETEMYRIPFGQIVYVKADGNWSWIYTTGPEQEWHNPLHIPLGLGEVWKIILKQIDDRHTIISCGKSHLINPDFIRLIDHSKQILLLFDGVRFHKLEPSRDALIELKALFKKLF